MSIAAKIGTEYYLFAGAGLISVFAFATLILIPALGSFARPWEKATAAFVSIFILLALLAIGIAVGVGLWWYWPDIEELFGN